VVPRTIRLGTLEIPRIGLGTNRLTRTPQNVEFVRAAAAAGIGVIDTAHLYTGGDSEATLGEALVEAGERRVIVATKGGYRPGEGSREVLSAQVSESLRRLRVDRIELYYLHRVDPQTPLEVSLEALAEHQAAGRIAHVGLSHVDVSEIERARQMMPIAAVQNEYSLASRGSEAVIDYCEAAGMAFVPYFPLRGSDHPRVAALASRRGATATQVALAWLLHRSPAMLPIPGTLSIDHVGQNVAALELELSEQEVAALA
jgi:pyridoxine 4-dehydrogenase